MLSLIHTQFFLITYLIIAIIGVLLVTKYFPVIHGLNWEEFSKPLQISQGFLNFLGSIIGWLALAYFIFLRVDVDFIISFSDFIVLIIAFYGITGYLPYILMQKGLPWK